MDFGLGDVETDDVFEELEFQNDGAGGRSRQITPFLTEVARSINPATQRFWRVRDETLANADGAPRSYDILALNTGHRDVGPDSEPWTFNDVYVTRARDCERFISHNPADSLGGCSSNEDVTDFVDGESLAGEDLIVWLGLTFHHIPRDEDESYMHSHWNHFQISPRDWTVGESDAGNQPPSFASIPDQRNNLGDSVSLSLQATDPDGDAVSISVQGLPPGLELVGNRIEGAVTTVGLYTVTVIAADPSGAAASRFFEWQVDPTGLACDECVDFTRDGNVSYSIQDASSLAVIEENGLALRMTGNTWRRTVATFDINAETVVEFDFEAFEEGEIHGARL